MNRFLKVSIIVIAVPVSVAAAVLLSQTITNDSSVYAQSANLQQRVEKYKASLSTNPSQNDLNKLKLRCSVAQSVLKNVSTRATKAQETRVAAYDSIIKNLNDLVTALKAKNIETTKLEAQIKDLQAKVDAYKKDAEAYSQAVTDSAELKCTDDPLALRAAIEESRNKLEKLNTEVSEIRTYINNVIKPTLKQIRADLVTQQKATTTAPTETQGEANATQ